MAEIKSFPNNQDVYVGAEWVMKWLHGRTSGVFGADGNLATSVVPDSMSVEVSDGVGWLSNDKGDGIVFWNDSEQANGSKLTLNHDVADGVLDRIDRIVVTWETTNYVALPTISILKGTASSKPVAPALTNNNIQRQISLARVNIPAGTVSLYPSMITDERLDPEVCGIVTETIEIDTSTMYAQFTELLERIQNNLEQILADQIPDGSITVPKLADETLSYINAINLADNSDFTQFIAQAGVGGNHGTQAYAGDRWILDSGTVTVEARTDGNGYTNIKLNGTIRQIVANAPDVGTAAIEMVSGTATIAYANGEITITSNGGVIKKVRLFEGEYTAETLPAYQPKGYSAELMECRRYYKQYGVTTLSGWINSTKDTIVLGFDYSDMRIVPTIEVDIQAGKCGNSGHIPANNLSFSKSDPDKMEIYLKNTLTTATANNPAAIRFNSLSLNADL